MTIDLPRAARTLRPTAPTVWIGLLGGQVAWSLHLLGSYFAVAMTCHAGDPHSWTFRAVQHGLTLLLAATAAGCGLLAYRTWRRVSPLTARHSTPEMPGTHSRDNPGEALRAAARVHMMAVLGMALDGFFLLAILFGGAANLFVPACG